MAFALSMAFSASTFRLDSPSSAPAPTPSFILVRLPVTAFWTWLAIFMFCLYNQHRPDSVAEDAINKLWRLCTKHTQRLGLLMLLCGGSLELSGAHTRCLWTRKDGRLAADVVAAAVFLSVFIPKTPGLSLEMLGLCCCMAGVLSFNLLRCLWLRTVERDILAYKSWCLCLENKRLVLLSYSGALFMSISVYRLFLHPLRQFPGPLAARLSKTFYGPYLNRNGKTHLEHGRLLDKYGPFVRIASADAQVIVHGAQTEISKLTLRDGTTRQRKSMARYCLGALAQFDKLTFKLTDEREQVKAILTAATDTVGGILGFTFSYVVRDPRVRDKLRRELGLFYGKTVLGEFSNRDLNNAEYLNAITDETLRLHNPSLNGGQRMSPPEGVMIEGVSIPGRVCVIVPHDHMLRSAKYIERPDEFIPEQWTTQPELVLDRRAYSPFLQGRHYLETRPTSFLMYDKAVILTSCD
ncbi:cytochrome P450 [Bombardia bombarda]|uniref:Cytochrome P450 n=1 Tax=Bombardia bombarda TaxID=252184 RepID=A0AA39XNQ2_9PEZI|nr:cytochrome P450 [Bombardia bombarda]